MPHPDDTEIIEHDPVDPRKDASDAGLRFALTDAVFSRWWKSIPPEYRDEFVSMHHGCPDGSLDLPRFVCALDHLLIQQNRGQTAGIIMDAWCLATGADAHARDTAPNASAAWGHDAVQQLLFRIRDSQSRQAVARIERLLTNALEADLLSDDQKRRDAATKNGLAFMRVVDERQRAEHETRLKRGLDRLKGDADAARRAFEKPTLDQAKEYMRALIDIYGPTEFSNVLQAALPPIEA